MARLSKIPHTFVIIFSLIIFCGILSWFVPSGEFQYEKREVNGVTRDVIVNDSYRVVDSSPQII